jgi:hypothetical protein
MRFPDIYDDEPPQAPEPCVEFDPPEHRPALYGPRGEVLRYSVDRLPAGYRRRNPHR